MLLNFSMIGSLKEYLERSYENNKVFFKNIFLCVFTSSQDET